MCCTGSVGADTMSYVHSLCSTRYWRVLRHLQSPKAACAPLKAEAYSQDAAALPSLICDRGQKLAYSSL